MRQPVLNLCLLGLVALCTVMGANSWAKSLHTQAPIPYSVSASYYNSSHELLLVVQETATNSAACDLVLTGLSYSAENQKLSLTFDSDFCQIDRFGQRKGIAKWQLPIPLRQSADIALEINGIAVGSIQIEDNSATHR